MKTFYALGLCALMAAGATAQNIQQTAGQSELQRSNRGNASQVDEFVASCLILANQAEIEMAKFGQENAEDDQIKQFAKQLVEDHQSLNSKLQRFASKEVSLQLSGNQGQNNWNNDRQTPQTQQFGQADAAGQMAGQSQTQKQLLQLKKEAVQNCVSMMKDELQENEGEEMGQAFIGSQIAAHISMLAELKAAENAVSGELQQVISTAKQKVESHLQKAKQLMKEQEKS